MRALPFAAGDAMRAGDPRLRAARIKVLALGFFRHVDPVKLRRGSRRGQVIASIRVVERGTVILNRMWFGTSLQTPWWVGLDATERNLAGSGLSIGAAFLFAGKGEASGSRSQRAGEVRLADPSILGTKFGAHGSFYLLRASEPYRIAGEASDDRPEQFNAFDYSRVGGRAGLSVALTPLSRLGVGARFERVRASTPAAATREFPDGTVRPVDLFLRAGDSNVSTLSVSFDRDTRSDPVLPYDGDRIQMYGELGAGILGSSYDFGILLAKYERWWALRTPRHVVSIHLTGGVVNGDAPRFDRFHVGDLNRLVTPRALGLVVSTTPSRDFFNTASDDVNYGEVGGVAEVQYAYRLFRRSRFVYGGDVFIGAGIWGLANADAVRVRDRSAAKALPIDLLIDIGLRPRHRDRDFRAQPRQRIGARTALRNERVAQVLLSLAICAAMGGSARADEVELQTVSMDFSEARGNLALTTSISDLFDEAAYEELTSGVASVIVIRFYVHKKGEDTASAFALAKVRVVYDLWDEEYLVRVEGPLGGSRSKYKRQSDALTAVTTFDKFPIAPLSRIDIGPHYVLSMVVELNPVSPELLAEVRRWLTKPAGQERLDAGSSFFGSFVSVFVNPKLAEADRIAKYRSQAFYRVDRSKKKKKK